MLWVIGIFIGFINSYKIISWAGEINPSNPGLLGHTDGVGGEVIEFNMIMFYYSNI